VVTEATEEVVTTNHSATITKAPTTNIRPLLTNTKPLLTNKEGHTTTNLHTGTITIAQVRTTAMGVDKILGPASLVGTGIMGANALM